MPSPKQMKPEPANEVIDVEDDVTVPTQIIRVLGHQVKLDGHHFDVNIAARWGSYPNTRRKLVEQGKAEDVLPLLLRIFIDAIGPSNPQWTEEDLEELFPWQAQIKILQYFFSWRLGEMEVELVSERVPTATITPARTQVNRRMRRHAV